MPNDTLCEVWRVGGAGVQLSNGAAQGSRVSYRFCDELLFGSITIDERLLEAGMPSAALRQRLRRRRALARATEIAYQEIFGVLRETEHRHLIRIWNYLPEINRETGGDERYRLFNSARQLAFRKSGQATVGTVPAASALGSPAGSPISIYFLASRQPPKMIENPRQTSAYYYPPKFGRHSPIFSRACVMHQSAGTNLFVSGTASIVGHETIHQGDVGAQTRETMANISALLDEVNRVVGAARYRLDGLKFKVYVREPADLGAIEAGAVEVAAVLDSNRILAGRCLPGGFAGGNRSHGRVGLAMNIAKRTDSNDAAAAKHYRWQELPAEPMKGSITRRLITGDRMMIAHVYLKKGDDVPQHSHENEQITYILEGALHFWLGEKASASSLYTPARCW